MRSRFGQNSGQLIHGAVNKLTPVNTKSPKILHGNNFNNFAMKENIL